MKKKQRLVWKVWQRFGTLVAAPVFSGALQLEVEISFQMRRIGMRKYFFGKDDYFNELEDLHEPETDSTLLQNANLMLADRCTAPAVPGLSLSLITGLFAAGHRGRCCWSDRAESGKRVAKVSDR